jgi:hypothetical protein
MAAAGEYTQLEPKKYWRRTSGIPGRRLTSSAWMKYHGKIAASTPRFCHTAIDIFRLENTSNLPMHRKV